MKRFQELSQDFLSYFNRNHFPEQPAGLYRAAAYMLEAGGKRIRPVLCLMGNELFAELHADAWKTATAIELFHNFTLIHDDIMDKAPLRRGNATVHAKYGVSSALLAGDVMLLRAYAYLNATEAGHAQRLTGEMNEVGRQVCEGQQLDMDFENSAAVTLNSYLQMIELKTAVLLAASLRMGALIARAGEADQQNLYAFGKNLGLAFQVQDDWLDAFGDPEKFGKKTGGDIIQNKKTFLLLKALESGDARQKKEILDLLSYDGAGKVEKMLALFSDCGVDKAAQLAQQHYYDRAMTELDQIRVPSERKIPLREMAAYLLQRNA